MKRLVALALLAACVAAPAARADGDPASDYLYAAKVFLPYDAKFPKTQASEFTSLVTAANKAGFRIRVAVIWSSYDMGSVTALWRKPQTYAKFLGLELSFLYKQRLLIVMPNGFGFNWPKHSASAEYATLSKIRIAPGAAGLLAAAKDGVTALAAADGLKLTPASASAKPSANHDREIILAAVLGALALGVLARYLVRRRR